MVWDSATASTEAARSTGTSSMRCGRSNTGIQREDERNNAGGLVQASVAKSSAFGRCAGSVMSKKKEKKLNVNLKFLAWDLSQGLSN